MDATEKERERLRRLAELYDRNDLTDDEYRLEYERLATSPLNEVPDGNTASMPRIQEMDSLKESSNERFAPTRNSEPRQQQSNKDTFASGSMHPHVRPTIAMRRVRPKMNQLVFVPLVFLLGIGVALTIGMVKGSAVKKNFPEITATSQQQTSTSASLTSHTTPATQLSPQVPFIVPQFGPDAVARCQSQCDRWGEQERKVCQRGCKRRDLEMYGRRITLDELNARSEADGIVQTCSAIQGSIPRAENEQLWRASLEPFIAALNAADSTQGAYHSKQVYQDMVAAQNHVRLPPNDTQGNDGMTLTILQASCLVAHDALALWAFETVERQSDEFSATFYAQLRDELAQPKLQKLSSAKKEIATLRGDSSL